MDKKLYKVIAVDDEIWALRGLCNIVDWEAMGFTVVGSYTDAREALDNITALRPDVVFTDIRMPEIDGMSLIETIRNSGAHAHLVIVSAYRDFDVAKRAIAKDVTDYLMKPLDKKEVADLLQRLHITLDKEQSDKGFDIKHYDLGEKKDLNNPEVRQYLEKITDSKCCRLVVSQRDLRADYTEVYIKGFKHAYLCIDRPETDSLVAELEAGEGSEIGISRVYGSYAEMEQMITDARTTCDCGFYYSDNPKIASVQEFLSEHYAEKLSLADIAAQFYVSESYLFELFRKNTDTSVVGLIKSIRLNKACALLIEGGHTISEIADTVGYPDVSYFGRVFKAKYGCTPEQYSGK